MKFMRNHWYDVAPGLVYLAVFIGGFMLKIGYGVLKKPILRIFFQKKNLNAGAVRNVFETAPDSPVDQFFYLSDHAAHDIRCSHLPHILIVCRHNVIHS